MTKLLIAVAALGISFLIGWYPQSQQVSALESEVASQRTNVEQLQARLDTANVRDAGALLYLEVVRQNYAQATPLATRFFDGLQKLAMSSSDEAEKARYRKILDQRDSVVSNLALAAPTLPSQLQAILLELHGREAQ